MYRGIIIKAFAVAILALLVSFGILFISKDMQGFHYRIEIQRCQSQIREIKEFDTKGKKIFISTYREAVPVLYVGREKIIDVCDYKILEQREIE